ncbi:MAG: hypothetical protein KDK60_01870 [Chlamydiia bacterium]|nr:hypothetical protein [Chlamydiia bacterium]
MIPSDITNKDMPPRPLKKTDCCSLKWMIIANTVKLNPGNYLFGHLQSVCTSCRLWENLTYLQQEK